MDNSQFFNKKLAYPKQAKNQCFSYHAGSLRQPEKRLPKSWPKCFFNCFGYAKFLFKNRVLLSQSKAKNQIVCKLLHISSSLNFSNITKNCIFEDKIQAIGMQLLMKLVGVTAGVFCFPPSWEASMPSDKML